MPRAYISAQQKQQINLRAHSRCEYCKSSRDYASHTFHVEHVIPVFAGGSTSIDNLALACAGCNGYKAVKVRGLDPASRTEVNLFHPRQQRWNEHFTWNEDFSEVIGLTPEGRATMEALKLNRVEVTNLRRIMRLAGLHPPADD